jgi:hypothetical protein
MLALPAYISPPRFTRYLTECSGDRVAALRLYHWNAQVSAAFLYPLHVLELGLRNAVANAVASHYGEGWPWTTSFTTSLPNPTRPNFSPRHELQMVRNRNATSGKVIADMKFAFWVSMLTSRHDGRLWSNYFFREFPNCPGSYGNGRRRVYEVADSVRELRNRIAHHEPIFARDLIADFAAIVEVVEYRCRETAGWMARSQTVSNLLTLRP